MRNRDYWVYILTNKHCTTLYIGITSGLQRRLWQHRSGEAEGFAKRYHLNRLVWFQHFREVRDAIACEKKLKGRRRDRKVALIEKTNPTWRDLGADLEQQPRLYSVPWNREEMIRDSSLCSESPRSFSCHVERSETSLTVVFRILRSNDQRFFAPLRMTEIASWKNLTS